MARANGVVMVSELREERLAQVRERYPAIRTTTDATALLADPEVDAVVVATPVSTHFDLAMAALRAGYRRVYGDTLPPPLHVEVWLPR